MLGDSGRYLYIIRDKYCTLLSSEFTRDNGGGWCKLQHTRA